MKNVLLLLSILLASAETSMATAPEGTKSGTIVTIESDYLLDTTTAAVRVYYDPATTEITGLNYSTSKGFVINRIIEEWKNPRDLLKQKGAAQLSAEKVSFNELKLKLTYAKQVYDSKTDQDIKVNRTSKYLIRRANGAFRLYDEANREVKKITAVIQTNWGVPVGISNLKNK